MKHKSNDNLHKLVDWIIEKHKTNKISGHTALALGITGSVAVGKSTLCEKIQRCLQENYPNKKIAIVPLDAFIFPRTTLQKKNILQRKGYSETFDAIPLFDFLTTLLSDFTQPYKIPFYSHALKDIDPHQDLIIQPADIYLIESISLFYKLHNKHDHEYIIYQLLDATIYVDADVTDIEIWYVERYLSNIKQINNQASLNMPELENLSDVEIVNYIKNIWRSVKLKLYHEYIAPYRSQADVLVNMNHSHLIESVKLNQIKQSHYSC